MTDVVQDRLHPAADIVLAQRHGLALALAQLVVDAPDVVGLLVDQDRPAGIAGRLEEGAPLGREVVLHADVGDDVAALEVLAGQAQPHHAAQRASRAVGRQQVAGAQRVRPGRRGDVECDAVGVAAQAGNLALPACVDQRVARDGVPQVLLDVLLLQVVHRQVLLMVAVRHLQPEDALPAVEALAVPPAQRLGEERLDRADPLQDLQAGAGEADRTAAVVEGFLAVEKDARDAVARQRQRRRHADRSGAGDRNGVAGRVAALLGHRAGGEHRVVEVQRVEGTLAGRSHEAPQGKPSGLVGRRGCGR